MGMGVWQLAKSFWGDSFEDTTGSSTFPDGRRPRRSSFIINGTKCLNKVDFKEDSSDEDKKLTLKITKISKVSSTVQQTVHRRG